MRSIIGASIGVSAMDSFERSIRRDAVLSRELTRILTAASDYEAAQAYAVRMGELLGKSLQDKLSNVDPPKIDESMASEMLLPLLSVAYGHIADACETAQNEINRRAGIGLKALRPNMPGSRAEDLAGKLADYETTADALWVLGEPVISWCIHIVDESVRINAEAQAAAGIATTVRRISDSKDCAYCNSHAGSFAPPLSREVFRRHERCRCLILLVPESGSPDRTARKRFAEATKTSRDARIARVLEAEKRLS